MVTCASGCFLVSDVQGGGAARTMREASIEERVRWRVRVRGICPRLRFEGVEPPQARPLFCRRPTRVQRAGAVNRLAAVDSHPSRWYRPCRGVAADVSTR